MIMQEPGFEEVDVVILCGGLGTRLKQVSKDLPKPMVEINGRPFLEIIIDHIASYGFRKFVLCTGYKKEVISEFFLQKNDGLTYVVSEENTPLGTGGGIHKAQELINSRMFLGLNGDSFCQLDLKEFVRFHIKNAAAISIALTSIDDPREYGSIELNENKEITGFNEKNSNQVGSALVNAGVYLFDKRSLDHFPVAENLSLEYDVFPSFVGNRLFGYVTYAPLFDIGTPQRLNILRKHFQSQENL